VTDAAFSALLDFCRSSIVRCIVEESGDPLLDSTWNHFKPPRPAATTASRRSVTTSTSASTTLNF
jgi:hypothetical protein